MLRRAVINMLLGNSTESTVTAESVALIDTPLHLKTDLTWSVVQEFQNLVAGQKLPLEVSTAHAFSISLSPFFDLAEVSGKAADTSLQEGVGLQVGFAAPPGESGIMLGLHRDGCLYMGDILDKRKLSFEKLRPGFKLKLEVNPQPGELTHAKLTLTDAAGLTLALLKNRQYATQVWKGDILISGLPLKHLKIEGRIIKRHKTITPHKK